MQMLKKIRVNQKRYQPPQSQNKPNACDGKDRSDDHNSDMPLHGSPFKGMPLALQGCIGITIPFSGK